MLGFSAAYNLARKSGHRDLLRRFDQAVIFIMIAGTYTPITILGLEGAWEMQPDFVCLGGRAPRF